LHEHIQVDLSDSESVMLAIAKVRAQLLEGRLDALVNNAGISPKGGNGKRLSSFSTPRQLWDEVFQVNFFSPLQMATGLINELRLAAGAIVNVTSIAGTRVHPFASAAYATSKAALAALTRELASDAGPMGVRVNAIAPGEIATPMLSPGTDALVQQIPMGRLGSPDEVADTIVYLCSPQASYLSGTEVPINGGQHV
jgi:NAD(P)-dependent dehydrogenase (short-subunit alcohol dehydrogenase family)